MRPLRTLFAGEIVTEFLPPKKPSDKVMIFCDGMPSMPNKKMLMKYWSRQGYWVFHLRYRGSWESMGKFLSQEPTQDVIDVIDGLSQEFISIWTGEKFQVNAEKIVVIGGSFGGPAAILASRDPRVDKAIAIAPVVDWSQESPDEPHELFYKIVKDGYGGAYRVTRDDFEKLYNGTFYNPIVHKEKLDGNKIMIIHARDDMTVLYPAVEQFAQDVGAAFYPVKKGGHLSSRRLARFPWTRRIKKFIQ